MQSKKQLFAMHCVTISLCSWSPNIVTIESEKMGFYVKSVSCPSYKWIVAASNTQSKNWALIHVLRLSFKVIWPPPSNVLLFLFQPSDVKRQKSVPEEQKKPSEDGGSPTELLDVRRPFEEEVCARALQKSATSCQVTLEQEANLIPLHFPHIHTHS